MGGKLHHTETLPYTVHQTPPTPGGFRQEAIFECRGCGTQAAVNIATDRHNPQRLIKRVKEEGWYVDQRNKRKVFCPGCLNRGREASKERLAMEPMRAAIEDSTRRILAEQQWDAAISAVRAADAEFAKAATTQPTTNQEQPTMATAKLLPQPGIVLAGDQPIPTVARVAIRGLLDQHFDDSTGRYLSGYSDDRIATELSIPRKWVTDIREAAYGALKEDPALSAVRAEADSIHTALEKLRVDTTIAVEGLRKRQDNLARRVDEIGRGGK